MPLGCAFGGWSFGGVERRCALLEAGFSRDVSVKFAILSEVGEAANRGVEIIPNACCFAKHAKGMAW